MGNIYNAYYYEENSRFDDSYLTHLVITNGEVSTLEQLEADTRIKNSRYTVTFYVPLGELPQPDMRYIVPALQRVCPDIMFLPPDTSLFDVKEARGKPYVILGKELITVHSIHVNQAQTLVDLLR